MRNRGAVPAGTPRTPSPRASAPWLFRFGTCACCWLLAGCEDGPDQALFPLQGQPPQVIGPPASDVFVAGDTKGFDDGVSDDDVGRAKFCAETEESALAQQMVVQPIVPDVSAGGLPL